MAAVLAERREQIRRAGSGNGEMACERPSTAGAVSQRACVFCGSRVVLYPIADALHLVHGPIGCAVYTWDIRGALSSGPQLHRNSFCTDLQERDVIHGAERKLAKCLTELIRVHRPKAAFVYATCIVGVIGDDVEAVCRRASAAAGIPVLAVASEGFKGTKRDGYRAACDALVKLIGTGDTAGITGPSINLLGEFNVAGETWIVRRYFERLGVRIVATMTGDGRVDDIRRAHGAALNVVQCSGSMLPLAQSMQGRYGIPFVRVSFFGIEDMAAALYAVADHFGDADMAARARELVRGELGTVLPVLAAYRERLAGRRAAIYVGGAFKAISLVRALRLLGVQTVVVGSQTGNTTDYRQLRALCDEGTIVVDDANPLELADFVREQRVDLFIGGVKERPIAHKLGVGFCDHNHERKIPLAGFEGMVHFAREVYATVASPVWSTARGRPLDTEFLRPVSGDGFVGAADLPVPALAGASAADTPDAAEPEHRTTHNGCKLCTPLGACLAFRGVAGAVPFLHGSQGCATYIRRYAISHFREPLDIASSSFGESDAVFGGAVSLSRGLDNVRQAYRPALIGVATTCLSETIGEDVAALLRDYRRDRAGDALPELVHVSTASYRGTHADGFHDTVRALVAALATAKCEPSGRVLLLPGLVSPDDLRHLRELADAFGLPVTLLPDYAETLDGPLAHTYRPLPEGGTPIDEIRRAGDARAVLQFGAALAHRPGTAADLLARRFDTAVHKLPWPVGVRATDALLSTFANLMGRPVPDPVARERGRLLDALVDGHKYVFGRRAVVYGEDDFVAAVAAFLIEIGVVPSVCATGSSGGSLTKAIAALWEEPPVAVRVMEGADFADIEAAAVAARPDLLIGNSKGYAIARRLGVPLVRLGFPVHDRLGAARMRLLGYRGSLELYDRIANALLERRQDRSPVGYAYL